MQPYIPDLPDLMGLAGLFIVLVMFVAIGALFAGRQAPEASLVAGWGLTAIVLTVWGVLTPASMRIPLAGLALVALAGLALPAVRRWDGVGRMAVLTLPFWLVMLPAWPSQVDTWLNLLPNAAYLFDHDMLPRQDRPPAWSFIPVAPYNTQFVAYAASVVAGRLIPNAMALFNLALLAAAGLLLARVLAGREKGTPPWWAVACGLGLAIALNPGFVPRTFLAGYGETPLAVCAMFAIWLAADALRDMAEGRAPRAGVALALVLAALVNVKQSGIGLLVPIGASFLALAVTHPAIPWRRGTAIVAAILAPSILLWLIWRGYALTSFEAGELRPRRFGDWNFALLPTILGSALRTIVQKATFYLCLIAVVVGAVLTWRRSPRSWEATLLALIVGTAFLYNGFLLFTYIAHFPPEMARNAHSYFRYSGHLSLLVMLGLSIWLRPLAEQAVMRLGGRARIAAGSAVVAALIFPVAITPMLRFDLQVPQPAAFALAPRIAAHLPPDARLALLVPGDPFDATGSLVRGALLFLDPRRPNLDVRTVNRADAETLAAAHRDGYGFALITCTPPGLMDIPSGVAALVRRETEGWSLVDSWPWPADLSGQRFGALLEYSAFCARR
jgi:riboflavin transporter FmnP